MEPLFDVLPMTWTCWKRLYELREQLYEPVKAEMASTKAMGYVFRKNRDTHKCNMYINIYIYI